MKVSTRQQALHQEALELVRSKDVLTEDEKLFVLENYHEGVSHANGLTGAFFTPNNLANNFKLNVIGGRSVIDLCAGIGALTYFVVKDYQWEEEKPTFTCLEINSEYVEVGKKIVPEATWICGNVLDQELIRSLGQFDTAIANPPFGKIRTRDKTKIGKYTGSEFEYRVISIASTLAKYGSFILPQLSTPYRYSSPEGSPRGTLSFEDPEKPGGINPALGKKLIKFVEDTDLFMEFNPGISTLEDVGSWKGVAPICEIVSFDFRKSFKEEMWPEPEPDPAPEPAKIIWAKNPSKNNQLELF